MRTVVLPDIRHDQEGFEALVSLIAQTEGCILEDVRIDMSATRWFDADMCAVFGAVLYQLGESLNTISLINIQHNVERILSKNGFLSHYGRGEIHDSWGTTLTYQRFDVGDDRYFADYVEDKLIHRPEMPEMSSGLLKKFRESIFEIFSNAVLHSDTKLGIFSCGQSFPNRKKLNFTVADLGVGIRYNIKKYRNLHLSSIEAIKWATEESNTTKRGNVPGGLGLKLLCEFIDLNRGRIQIVSEKGYWLRQEGGIRTVPLSHPFPGTVVSFEIDTADTKSYSLASEPAAGEIF